MTKKLSKFYLLTLMSVPLLACSASTSTSVSIIKDGVKISAKIGNTSINDSTKAHFVHAKLIVHGSGKGLKSINLNCFALTVGNVTSDEIDVDSIASVLNDPYPADTHGRIDVAVYWVFSDGRGFDIQKLPSAKLSLKSYASSPCFRY